MKDDLNYIDEFYKNHLEGYTEAAETDAWGKLKWRLFWLRYKWMLTGSTILVLLIATAMIIPFNTGEYANKNISVTNNQISSISSISTFTVSEKNIKPQTDKNNNQKTEEVLIVERNSEDGSIINKIGSLNIDYEFSFLPDSLLMGSNRRTDILPPRARNTWFSANIYGGPSFSSSSLSGNNSEYIDLRNKNENNASAYSLGGDLRFHYKNFVISSGINYSVYNQNRYYKKTYSEYSPDDSYYDYDTTWVWIYDPPDFGKPVISDIDSTWTKVYNDIVVDNSGTNSIRYIEIPIMLGYTFNKNLFSFEINAGASAGFLICSNFKTPSFSNYEEINKVEQMNKALFNFIGNASVYYHVNYKTSIFVSPYYIQNLNSIFDNSFQINQKFKTIGVNFGMSFKF